MTGMDPDGLVEAIPVVTAERGGCPADYEIRDVSRRVVHVILSTVRRHHEWAGVRPPPANTVAPR